MFPAPPQDGPDDPPPDPPDPPHLVVAELLLAPYPPHADVKLNTELLFPTLPFGPYGGLVVAAPPAPTTTG